MGANFAYVSIYFSLLEQKTCSFGKNWKYEFKLATWLCCGKGRPTFTAVKVTIMRKLVCFPWSTNDLVGHQITAECESGNGLVYKFLTPRFSSSNFMRSLFCNSRWDKANSISFNFCRNWQQNKRRSAESCHVCIPLSVAGSHSIWPFVKVAVTEKSFDTQRGSRLSSFDVLSQTRMPKKK